MTTEGLISVLIRLCLFALLTSAAMCLPCFAQDFGDLDGTWEGTLSFVPGLGWWFKQGDSARETKVIIRGNTARLFQQEGGTFVERKPERLKIERLMTNAIIFAIDSGRDKDGTWVQNTVYAVTQKDHDALIVNVYTMANNLNKPPSAAFSKWSAAATGELKRMK
jgi:hypothetical protein